MSSTEVNESLQEEGRISAEESRMVSRRTLIKAAWTVPVVAATVTPSSVFAGCSMVDTSGSPHCTQYASYYENVSNFVKDNMWSDYRLNVGGLDLNRDQIVSVLSNNSTISSPDVRLFRELVATKIGVTNNLSPTDTWKSFDNRTVNDLIAWADTALANAKFNGTQITQTYATADEKRAVLQEMSNTQGFLLNYIETYNCKWNTH